MRHTDANIRPTRRYSSSPVILLLLVIFTFLLVVIFSLKLSLDYAVGFGSSQSASTNNVGNNNLEALSFKDETKTDLDVVRASASRDVSNLYQEIAHEEEEKLKAEQEAQRAHERECIDNANARKAACGKVDDGVDFNIGRDAFINLWGERIDRYLKGSAMAGLGKKYAEAAFEYGVDPRVSPAISNTESTKGANCFRPHNAWGWMGSSGWSDWESAIDAHVKGLSEKYDYTISLAFAQKYCPPTYKDWYAKTLSELNKI